MSILIDGHNLIGQIHDLSLSDDDDEAKLIQRLRLYRNVVNRPITVFFDSGETYTPPYDLSGSGITVVFASLNNSADAHLMARIEHCADAHQLLVVSSDHEIQQFARRRGAEVMASQEFARKMSETHAPKRKRRKRRPKDQAVSKREVEEWLDIFNNRPD
jgi:predicted RNA-binding protein with PIN domain